MPLKAVLLLLVGGVQLHALRLVPLHFKVVAVTSKQCYSLPLSMLWLRRGHV
jgi:hypothetical protein